MYMTRHTKFQLIDGAEAISLPKSTTAIKMISMTDWERKTFENALQKCNDVKVIGQSALRRDCMRRFIKSKASRERFRGLAVTISHISSDVRGVPAAAKANNSLPLMTYLT